MFTKIAIGLAIIAGPASGALAAPKQSGSAPYWTGFDCPGVPGGSDPRILVNRPKNGTCNWAEE